MASEVFKIYNNTEKFFDVCSRQRELFEYQRRYGAPLVYDTETTGIKFGVPSMLFVNDEKQIAVKNPTAFGMSMCLRYHDSLNIFWARHDTKLFSEMAGLLSCQCQKIAHNARYDLRVLRGQGIVVKPTYDCTLLMSRIINDNEMLHSLKVLGEPICPELAGWDEPVKKIVRNIKSKYTRKGYPKDYVNYSFIPEEIMREYAGIDAFMTYMLFLKYTDTIHKEHAEVYKREIAVMQEAILAENYGIYFNSERAKEESAKLKVKCKKLVTKIQKSIGKVNPESPKQLLAGLENIGFTKNMLSYRGAISTRAEVLRRVVTNPDATIKQNKVADRILKLRSYRKLISSYLQPISKLADYNNGIVYCNINSADTKTSRMSISDPSLQNIPRPTSGIDGDNPVRACFGPRPGYEWLLFDYSQIEMLFFCVLAGAWGIVEEYMNGADIHTEMTIKVHGKKALDKDGKVIKAYRQMTKSVNFGILYGMGIKALAEILKVTVAQAESILRMYKERIPEIEPFMRKCSDSVYETGGMQGMFGKYYTGDRTKAYVMVNKQVQGGCAQILKIGMLQALGKLRQLKWDNKTKLVLPIHDELIFEKKIKSAIPNNVFVRIMKNQLECIPELMKMGVRIRAEVAHTRTTWAEKKEFVLC